MFLFFFISYKNSLLYLHIGPTVKEKQNIFAWLLLMSVSTTSVIVSPEQFNLSVPVSPGNQSFPKDQLQCMAGAQFVFIAKFRWIPPWAPPHYEVNIQHNQWKTTFLEHSLFLSNQEFTPPLRCICIHFTRGVRSHGQEQLGIQPTWPNPLLCEWLTQSDGQLKLLRDFVSSGLHDWCR